MKTSLLMISIFMLAVLIFPMIIVNMDRPYAPVIQNEESLKKTSVIGGEMPLIHEQQEDEAEEGEEGENAIEMTPLEEEPGAFPKSGITEPQSFLILDESTGKVIEVSVKDFVRGAVAAEMPVSFHTEALKAQAVAAHTFALQNHLAQQKNPDKALKGADFSADPSNMKVFVTEAKAKEFYGEKYADIYWDKICAAADSVVNYIIEYDEQPIVAAYHAISAGNTEAAENVWSGGADYLIPAESEGDFLAPDYETEVILSPVEVKAAVQALYPDTDLSDNYGDWFTVNERSGSGYVTSVNIGDTELHGKEVRVMLDLRSHNFDVDFDGDNFVFTVLGYGHGVGLSQYGADFLARQGYSFDEILYNYYNGVRIAEVMA